MVDCKIVCLAFAMAQHFGMHLCHVAAFRRQGSQVCLVPHAAHCSNLVPWACGCAVQLSMQRLTWQVPARAGGSARLALPGALQAHHAPALADGAAQPDAGACRWSDAWHHAPFCNSWSAGCYSLLSAQSPGVPVQLGCLSFMASSRYVHKRTKCHRSLAPAALACPPNAPPGSAHAAERPGRRRRWAARGTCRAR